MNSCGDTLARWALIGLVVLGLVACGGGSSSPNSSTPVSLGNPSTGNNVMAVYVDLGPNGNDVNRLYTNITICQPGTSVCETIDHVLVDTGSTGLRLLSEAVTNPAITQSSVRTGTNPLLSCAQFLDLSYAWGPVVKVDLQLGGETIPNLPTQLAGAPTYAALGQASACAGSGTYEALNTVAQLGAKGILGMGLLQRDCGSLCTTNAAIGYYYTCTTNACNAITGATASLSEQLRNPVPLLRFDNNGFVVNLPAVPAPGASSLTGEIVFGIDTQSNNAFSNVTALTTNSLGYIRRTQVTSSQAVATYASSFIDTGSNGIFFDSTWDALQPCGLRPDPEGFYCPSTDLALSAIMTGFNLSSKPVNFNVSNAKTLFQNRNDAVIPSLGGPINWIGIFDWGLPFYFGRKVFHGIDGEVTTLGTGPFIAF